MSLFEISLLIVFILVAGPILIWIGRGVVQLFRHTRAKAVGRRKRSEDR